MTTTAASGSIIDHLRNHDQYASWLEYLQSLPEEPVDVRLPDDATLEAILRDFEVPEEDIPDVVASRPDRDWTPETRWLFDRSMQSLLTNMGNNAPPPWFPPPHEIEGMDRYFFVHVFVAMLPHVRTYHWSHGITDDDAHAIFADLGRNIRVHHKRYGEGGLGVSFWLSLHFRGMIYQFGRLQFERSRMRGRIAEAVTARGADADPDDLVLSLHIPDFIGPLTPDACDASIAMAKPFFARHFPTERYEYAVCHSWLLDPQLKDYLPPTSNIIHFQNRFELAEGGNVADTSIVQFVFGPALENPGDLPERTSLERAVKRHLLAGKSWYSRAGWFRLT